MRCYRVWVNIDRLGAQTQYNLGIIQGLMYGMCAIPCGTPLIDFDLFEDKALFTVYCGGTEFTKFRSQLDKMWPGAFDIKVYEA